MAVSFTTFAQAGIGTTTPDPSAALDITALDKGLLLPRVASTDAISSPPVNGLMIYDTTADCVKVFQNGGWSGCLYAVAAYSLTSVDSYNGISVIDPTGIGYNGEAIPAASTITVNVDVTGLGAYNVSATDGTIGLEYSAAGTFTVLGAQTIVLANNNVVIPEFTSGVIALTLAGDATNTLALNPRIDIKSIPTSATAVVPVNLGNGQMFMDRNLGARRAATALDDTFAYGNYYQWGRPADGHEITVWNGTTKTDGRGLADPTAAIGTSDVPGHPNFIINATTPFDWRDDNNNNRWNGASQGPCPTDYHVPTDAEWATADAAAFGSGSGNNGADTAGWDNQVEAYESTLKLPSSGRRGRGNGSLSRQAISGHYWSSTFSGFNASNLDFTSTVAITANNSRGGGYTVRCLKD